MNIADLEALLALFNLDNRVTLERYSEVFEYVKERYGEAAAAKFADCWIPDGEAVQPGYEDSATHYVLAPWKELKVAFDRR